MIEESVPLSIEKAEQIAEYRLRLYFSDGHIQEVDLENFLFSSTNPHIQKYQDPEVFAGFEISDGDLQWNDYDLCFSLEDLYENKNLGNKKHSAA
ncbi:DUF2442 domain-containing protein [Marinospirillum perlucidum]|uniref:DUF2442 domain-containing protein n=1 Tax=Marinospirillum perlucidum TaxID=1982602 RepID=UPI000DF375DC|nr:DUF2442 domain-containing protein [Marinospirillum perlucidum]